MSTEISLMLDQNDYQNLVKLLSSNIQFDFLTRNVIDELYGKKLLKISREQNEALINELSNIFMEKGLRPDHEPNGLGYLIESLIDTIGRHLYN